MYAVYYGQELALLALITRAPEDRRRRRRYLTKRTLAETWLKSEEKKKRKCPFWKAEMEEESERKEREKAEGKLIGVRTRSMDHAQAPHKFL